MMKDKTVFLAIPNFVFISDILRTKYIEYLATKIGKVIVITPYIDEKIAEQQGYFKTDNVIYEMYKVENPKFWDLFKLLRVSLVNEFDHLNYMKHWYKRPVYKKDFKRKLIRSFGKPLSKILTANFLTDVEKFFLPKSKRFLELTDKYKPSLVLTPSPGLNTYETEVIIQAKMLGISTVAMNFTWDNLTTNCKHIRKTDFLIGWNSISKKEAIEIHKYPEDRIYIAGIMRFDPYFANEENDPSRDTFIKSKGLNPELKTLFYTPPTKAYPFNKKYIIDLINLRKEKKIPYVNIFVRIHPRDEYENYKEFQNIPDFHLEKAGQVVFDTDANTRKIEMNYKDLLNLKYSIKYTDININYLSTISLEACIFDKPVINVGYIGRFALGYEFEHYLPMYNSGAVRIVKSDEDLARFINMYLENPAIDRENRKKVVDLLVEFSDGLSYKRNVECLEKIYEYINYRTK